jgi:tetratricopeptide (TPR) repeat protein
MKHTVRAAVPALLLSLTLAVGFTALCGAVAAQEGDAAQTEKDARKEAKRLEREARIEEYLRKKEERRAQRELERQQKEAPTAQQQSGEAVDLATFSATTGQAGQADEIVVLPRELARVQTLVRDGPLGQDPTVRGYLDLIDRAEASPHQLAAFGNFLSESGWPEGALEYYAVALSIEQEDPVLWLNTGTLLRKLGEHKAALDAYQRALSLDPNNAYAHYNLGVVLDDTGKYEDALVEYKIALTLDPALGDPATNPQVAHNERLLAVKLLLYKEQIGNVGLPLVEVPGGELEPEPEE